MVRQERHIVSKISWDLAFDQRSTVQELQSKFGAWSKGNMLNEMNALFHQLCPSDQTWQIQQITLDLGDLNYDEIEDELPIRFRTALYEKLIELTYKSGRGDKNLQVLKGENAQLLLLEKFLEFGYLPWNETGIRSVNDLLVSQLENNRKALLDMILVAGQSVKVRKRIAWQFHENVIKDLIILIEPNNSNQINLLADELILVQEKETVVQTGIIDFKKNLWFWVLNQLFEDRGSLYNRLDFVQNSIQQMANHYNLSYEDLFSEIHAGAARISTARAVSADFIMVLNLLGKKHKKRKNIVDDNHDNQNVILDHFYNYLTYGVRSTSFEFNAPIELIFNQAITFNSKKIESLFTGKELNPSALKDLVNSMNESSLEALIHMVFKQNGIRIVHLAALMKNSRVNSNWNSSNWYKSLFLTINNQKINGIGLHEFWTNILHDLEKKHPVAATELYEQMVVNLPDFTNSSDIDLGILREIISVIRQRYLIHLESDTKLNLDAYIAYFFSGQHVLFSSNEFANQLDAVPNLKQFIQRNPVTFIRAIQQNKIHVNKLEIFVENLDTKLIDKLILKALNTNSITKNECEIILTIRKILSKIKGTEFMKIHDRNMVVSLLKNPKFSVSNVISGEYFAVLTGNERRQLSQLLLLENRFKSVKNSRILALIDPSNSVFEATAIAPASLKMLANHVVNGNLAKNEGLQYLETILEKADFQVKIKDLNHVKLILNHFISGSYDLFSLCIKHVSNGRNVALKQLIDRLSIKERSTIFWRVIYDYSSHHYSFTTFSKLLELTLAKAISLRSDLEYDNHQISRTVDTGIEAFSIKKRYKNDFKNGVEVVKSSTHASNVNSGQVAFDSSEEKEIAQGLNRLVESKLDEGEIRKLEAQIRAFSGLDPAQLQVILSEFSDQKALLHTLQRHFTFEFITAHLINYRLPIAEEFTTIYHFLSQLIVFKGDSKSQKILENEVLRLIGVLWTKPSAFLDEIEILIRFMLTELTLSKGMNANDMMQFLNQENRQLSKTLKQVLMKIDPIFTTVFEVESTNETPIRLAEILRSNLAFDFLESIFVAQKIPNWTVFHPSIHVVDLQKIILINEPKKLALIVTQTANFELLLEQIQVNIGTKEWFVFLKKVAVNQLVLIEAIERIMNCIEQVIEDPIRRKNLSEIIYRKTAIAIRTGNWNPLSSQRIWQEISWDAKLRFNIKQTELLHEFQQNEAYLSVGYRMTLQNLYEKNLPVKNVAIHLKNEQKKVDQTKREMIKQHEKIETPLISEGIQINNAGLVLVNSYLKMLFSRLNLLENDQLSSVESRMKATYYLQYVVNGLVDQEEYALVLNKVICGLHPTVPLTFSFQITEDEKELIDGMVTAMINYWPAIGDSSVDGFRGNWLIRNGILREQEDRWTLDVEKRAYDILLQRSPFSFGIIKYDWMPKPIHVQWPF